MRLGHHHVRWRPPHIVVVLPFSSSSVRPAAMRQEALACAAVVSATLALVLIRRRATRAAYDLPSEDEGAASSSSNGNGMAVAVPPTKEALAKAAAAAAAEAAAAAAAADRRQQQQQVRISRTPSKVSLDGESRFGLDIGGSLLKLIYLELETDTNDPVVHSLAMLDNLRTPRGSLDAAPASSPPESAKQSPGEKRGFREPSLSVSVPALGGRLHFAHFATVDVEAAVEILRTHRLCDGLDSIHATGGGAHKFRELIERKLDLEILPCNELDAVVLGICLMAKAVSDECFTYERVADPAAAQQDGAEQPQAVTIPSEQLGIVDPFVKIHRPFSSQRGEDFFPFLLCNVGTGVSILHVQSETEYTRVSGTALGGGTFLGLTRLLTQMRSFQQALDSAANGDARHVDMLVADIYGADARGLNLPSDLTASFFAKNLLRKDREPRESCSDDDICKALVVMIAQNLAQIAHLNARIHGLKRVFFTGNFLRANDLALRTIVYTMQRWSQLDQCTTEAVFFRHEGYFGAVGAFLQTISSDFVRDLDFQGDSSASSKDERTDERSEQAERDYSASPKGSPLRPPHARHE